MRKTLYLLILSLLLYSCSEDEGNFLSSKLELQEVTIENNKVKLQWNRPYLPGFINYVIYKTPEPFNQSGYYYNNLVATITEADETIYYVNLSLDEDVYYTVIAYSEYGEPLVSNSQRFIRDDLIIFENTPTDVVFDATNKLLFVFVNNKIYKCNYENMEVEDSILLSSSNNYGSIGDYNGQKELYVGCSNGFLRIYNIGTLEEKAYVMLGGNVINAELNDQNILFIKAYDDYDGIIYSYNRASLNMIDQYESWYSENGKIKLFRNVNRVVEIDDSYRISYYDYSEDGTIINADYEYDYSYPKSTEIFELFPNEDKIITHHAGAIYNSNLQYVTQLGDSYYDHYNHFFIDDYIYAASGEYKQVRTFSKSSYNLIKIYETSFYPVKVFKDGNELVIFGSNEVYYGAKYTIEKISIN